MFVGRERELAFLRQALSEKSSQFIVVYGKRRVGKTELVKQFSREVPHIYFLADKASEKDQLSQLAEKIGLFFKDDLLISRSFGSWHEALKYLHGKGRVVLAIDEFPFLIESNKAAPSIFQKGWDEYLKDSGIFLILLGSSVGMMETEVLGHKSPLFGRRTGQLLIELLGFREAAKFFPGKDVDRFMQIYAILGGTPAYLLQFERSADLWSNIKKRVLAPEAYLYSEVEFILREELREPRNYFALLRAISMGKTRVSEIINETGFEKNIVGKYLSVLCDLHIIKRELPITEQSYEKSKKGIYIIGDNFFRFWFRFVFPNKSFTAEGEIDYVIKNKIRPQFDIFVSQAYEEVCRAQVRAGIDRQLKFNRVGRWWIKDAEIDVVGLNEDNNEILFGEAKWSAKKVGVDVLEDLKRKAALVQWGKPGRKEHYALFSRSGFTDNLLKMAEKEKILLRSPL
jgi:uncharacterized protein